jgi:hypothetical protein
MRNQPCHAHGSSFARPSSSVTELTPFPGSCSRDTGSRCTPLSQDVRVAGTVRCLVLHDEMTWHSAWSSVIYVRCPLFLLEVHISLAPVLSFFAFHHRNSK